MFRKGNEEEGYGQKKRSFINPSFLQTNIKNHNQSLVTWFSKSYSIYSFHKNLSFVFSVAP